MKNSSKAVMSIRHRGTDPRLFSGPFINGHRKPTTSCASLLAYLSYDVFCCIEYVWVFHDIVLYLTTDYTDWRTIEGQRRSAKILWGNFARDHDFKVSAYVINIIIIIIIVVYLCEVFRDQCCSCHNKLPGVEQKAMFTGLVGCSIFVTGVFYCELCYIV